MMLVPDDDVFAHALEYSDSEQQDQYVSEVCRTDPTQRSRVLSLLKTWRRMNKDGRSESILERASQRLTSLALDSEPLSENIIDCYRLVEKLGEGGMGLVYSAEQSHPVSRMVALKLLRPGMNSRQILARFAQEKQLLEQMEHSGITRVLDAGVLNDGRPFFAMELVRNAVRITDYCDRKQLRIRERIQLLIRVCGVVHYAHQRGVIHRDLKPSNILISADEEQPQPRIIDFGIAKVLNPRNDSPDHTKHGECPGTPAYMSPEQALLASRTPDVRSDVYSLGVVLYELLTGDTPRPHRQLTTGDVSWKNADFWKQQVPVPSKRISSDGDLATEVAQNRGCTLITLRQALTRDLDSILQKALATDQDERYQSVSDFQRDLESLLAGDPVAAVGPSRMYRLRKLILRHRWASAAATIAFAAILSTSVLATLFAFRANRAELSASQRLTEVLAVQEDLRKQREEAERSSQQARAVLKILQSQSACMADVSRFTEPLLRAGMSGEPLKPELIAQFSGGLHAEVLSAPDPRLIVRGDWSWAESSIDLAVDAVRTQIELTSRDALADSGFDQPQTMPEASERRSENESPAKFVYQKLLLEELQKKVPPEDPFLAEVLDNCGLLATRLNDHTSAVEFLSRSTRIWQQHRKHRLNHVQSQLFLAEAMIHLGRTSEALSLLKPAEAELGNSSPATPEIAQLQVLLQQLQAQISATIGGDLQDHDIH